MWALALLAGGVGLVTYAVGQAGSFSITQRIDPSRATLDRNRYVAFGLLGVAGLFMAAKSKGLTGQLLGAGAAAGAVVGLAGTELSLAIGRVTDLTTSPAVLAQPPAAKALSVNGLALGQQQFAAVYGGGGRQQFMTAVYNPDGVQRLGALGGQNMGATFTGGQQSFGNAGGDEYFGG